MSTMQLPILCFIIPRYWLKSLQVFDSDVSTVPCAIRAAYRFEMRERLSSDQIYFHVFCPKHVSQARQVSSVNSLGLDFMKKRKRKFAGDIHSGSSKKAAKTRMFLMPTKLDSNQKLALDRFCCFFQASIKQAFSNSVTHVITNCTKKCGGGHLKNRTTKLQFGIVSGKWIMCFDWITESLESGNLLSEEDFEVVSDPKAALLPRRLRLARTQKLFDNVKFSFGAVSDMKKSVLEDISMLISLEGGEVVELDGSVDRREVLIIDSENFFKKNWRAGEQHITSTWIFDCVSNLKFIDFPR
eukprot:TRINITY_DN29524_c0_g1_i4.p2 TRINITY_DN29524_c0_g1~~TRINITY_DN29524_c0_g1_i4.p2  ORF type:complete len:299 (-),score=58.92 TRINITY_DN29524_c0_g1_i4:1695-2591(-)